MALASEPRLRLDGLAIRVADRLLVKDVALELRGGRIVALVGASGSGKTLTARSLLGLVDVDPGVVAADLVVEADGRTWRPYEGCLGLRGVASRRARDASFREVRRRVLGYLPQDAKAALDPLLPVGRQIEMARADGDTTAATGRLKQAGIADPERVVRLYPHELSGGMAQRVVLAQALAHGSRLLVADEPTTALDATVQAEVLAELKALAGRGLGLLLITHDLRVLPGFADEVLVMEGGRLAERADPVQLTTGVMHSDPARRLLDATRRIAGGRLG